MDSAQGNLSFSLSKLKSKSAVRDQGVCPDIVKSILTDRIVPKSNAQDRREKTQRALFRRRLYYSSLASGQEVDQAIEKEDHSSTFDVTQQKVSKILSMLQKRKTMYESSHQKSRSMQNTSHGFVHFPKPVENYKINLMKLTGSPEGAVEESKDNF